jgi:hypothetical protein
MTSEKLFASTEAADEAGLMVTCFLVIGFPHDTPEDLEANFPFLEALAQRGVSDVGINFYMALPGTELFQSLYEAGRIKIDRKYFRHILSALAPIPSQSFCENLSRLDLAIWKVRLFRKFYGLKRQGEGGLFSAVLRGVRGVFRKDDHQTKLETAVRLAFVSAVQTAASILRPRYMSRSEERAMFTAWDGIYRRIHEQKLECGAVGRTETDTAELHLGNIIPGLVKEHATPRTITSVAG